MEKLAALGNDRIQPSMNTLTAALRVLLLTILIVFLGGCNGCDNNPPPPPPASDMLTLVVLLWDGSIWGCGFDSGNLPGTTWTNMSPAPTGGAKFTSIDCARFGATMNVA